MSDGSNYDSMDVPSGLEPCELDMDDSMISGTGEVDYQYGAGTYHPDGSVSTRYSAPVNGGGGRGGSSSGGDGGDWDGGTA